MGTYISSNANRFYVALESSYGLAAAVTSVNRYPAVRLQAQQLIQLTKRLDKTGTRTFLGSPATARRQTAFETRTYLTSWNGGGQPGYGPLVQAALGAAPQISQGLTVASSASAAQFQTTNPHGLSPGAAVSSGFEIRFVITVPDQSTLVVNAPFSAPLAANSVLATALTYTLSTSLPTLTLYDYWDPAGAVSRVVTGAAVDTFEILVNGDYHEFVFSGPAGDLLNSSSFGANTAGLSNFPAEPALSVFDYSIVPGHLGQVWLGNPANQFSTLTQANIEIKNNVAMRDQEFGSSYPLGIAPGPREVISQFSLFAQDDAQTNALYAAAKLRAQMPAMLQLGQQEGQIMGIYLPSVTPEIPDYNDSETRLLWDFRNNLAQGAANDEIYVAFA